MGSAQSYLSPEAALTTLVVAGAIGLGYTQIGHGSASKGTSTAVSNSTGTTPPSDKLGQLTNKGKKKKQAKSSVVLSDDISDKSRSSINDKSSQLPTTSPTIHTELGRVGNTSPGFPGQFEPAATPDFQLSDIAAASSSLSKGKKSKKKKAKSAVVTDPVVQQVAASSSADYSSEVSVKPKTKNPKRQQQIQPSSQMTRPLQQSTTSIDTDGSWTRVGPVRRGTVLSKRSTTSLDATTSDVDADAGLTPHTGNSSPIAERGREGEEPSSFLLDIGSRDSGENRRTLAEKLLPKPRKTGVDDMLATSDYPTLARVIRVQPLPDEKPASGFSWADYEDVRVTTDGGENDADGEDDGWGVVKSRRQKVDRTSASALTSSHQAQKASETMTKRQRQNAQKRENEKAAKAEAEAQRLVVLAKHKQELERTRVLEQYGGKSTGKTPSGGMKASVDERGKLVWE